MSQAVILYIEDNAANMRLMQQLIENHTDYQLHTAELPQEGIKLAQSLKPDLIFLDINLPTMNGFQVLDYLRNNEHSKNIPVVAISADAMPEAIRQGEKAGFDDYVTKPVDVMALLELLKKYLSPAAADSTQ